MLASRNEFSSLLKQALAGSYLATGDYAGSSQQILWAAQHGVIDWPNFDETLQRIATDATQPQYPITEVNPRYKQQVELNGASMGVFGSSLGDFSIAHAVISNLATAQYCNCRDFELLVSKLGEAGDRGLSGALFWCAGSQVTLYEIEPGEGLPNLFNTSPIQGLAEQTVVLALALNPKKYVGYMHKYWPDLMTDRELITSSSDFARRQQSSLDAGIEVPDRIWKKLNKMAQRMLVPNSQQSRQGAGE